MHSMIDWGQLGVVEGKRSGEWSKKVTNFSGEYSWERRVQWRQGAIRKLSTAGRDAQHGGYWRGKVYSEEKWNRVGRWKVIMARSGAHWGGSTRA